MVKRYESWGRYPKSSQQVLRVDGQFVPMDLMKIRNKVLGFGFGRSYGDVCLNDGGTLLDTAGLDHFIDFDAVNGILECEAGVTLDEILRIFVPKGWFPPVVPGTKYVTLGGAIANDIHGKNHHREGTFGRHILSFELLRSSGERFHCTPFENGELFKATIGGLGLTGLVLSARIKLQPIPSPWLNVEHIPFASLDEFFALSQESDDGYEFTVSWVDCVSGKAGRGIFMRGNRDSEPGKNFCRPGAGNTQRFRVLFELPEFLMNSWTMQCFNQFYYWQQTNQRGIRKVFYESFFFPLDVVEDWNRLYGRRGFLQYQFVLPEKNEGYIKDILARISNSKAGSFLAVLKRFGQLPSPGMLSFPKAGITLALDFPCRAEVFKLLSELDDLVMRYEGAVYPAKDARMSARHFKSFYPQWSEFKKYIDPCFSSGFWTRVTEEAGAR